MNDASSRLWASGRAARQDIMGNSVRELGTISRDNPMCSRFPLQPVTTTAFASTTSTSTSKLEPSSPIPKSTNQGQKKLKKVEVANQVNAVFAKLTDPLESTILVAKERDEMVEWEL